MAALASAPAGCGGDSTSILSEPGTAQKPNVLFIGIDDLNRR